MIRQWLWELLKIFFQIVYGDFFGNPFCNFLMIPVDNSFGNYLGNFFYILLRTSPQNPAGIYCVIISALSFEIDSANFMWITSWNLCETFGGNSSENSFRDYFSIFLSDFISQSLGLQVGLDYPFRSRVQALPLIICHKRNAVRSYNFEWSLIKVSFVKISAL